MFKYVFLGKIIPERVDFSLTPHTVETYTENNEQIRISISIEKSNIYIEVESDTNFDNDIETLRNGISDYVRQYSNIYGYLHGYSYDVEITSVVFQDKSQKVFGVEIKALEEDYENRPIQDFNKIFLLTSGKNQNLRLALFDLNLSIKHPKDTGVFCFRAIESIMQYFNIGDPENAHDRKKAWEVMNKNLRISEKHVEYVRGFALNPRHGTLKSISGNERVEIMKRTWKIVDRFLIYLTNDEKPLDDSFPEL